MGWTAAEGDRFSGSTPHPRDHPPSGPASVVTSTCLRGFFWCRGRRIDQPAPRGHGRGQLRRMLRALRFPDGFQFTDGRRAWHQGEQGNARRYGRVPPRRPVMGEGCRQAEHRRAPHSYRRPLDASGRPPGAPSART